MHLLGRSCGHTAAGRSSGQARGLRPSLYHRRVGHATSVTIRYRMGGSTSPPAAPAGYPRLAAGGLPEVGGRWATRGWRPAGCPGLGLGCPLTAGWVSVPTGAAGGLPRVRGPTRARGATRRWPYGGQQVVFCPAPVARQGAASSPRLLSTLAMEYSVPASSTKNAATATAVSRLASRGSTIVRQPRVL